MSGTPVTDLPIYGDDEDDDGVKKPKYLSNQHYSEIMYSPIEITLTLDINVDRLHPHLFDKELVFVDFAIRKILIDDNFHVWDVEVESHSLSNVVVHPMLPGMFQCDYNGIFSVVNKAVMLSKLFYYSITY